MNCVSRTTAGLLALGASAALLAACPPVLSGEPCLTSNNCPSGESCVQAADGGLVCEPGRDGDAGSTATGLYGVVTLNNGAAKPAGNDAWVYVYAGGGTPASNATPLFTVTANPDGTFQVPQAADNQDYFLIAQYDIQRLGNMAQAATLYKFGGLGAVNTKQNPVQLDVQTATCLIFANHAASNSSALLWEAIADIPDVQTGIELTSGVRATVTGATLQTQSLNLQGSTTDLLSTGKWAFIPVDPMARPQADTTYSFKVSAPSYNGVTCAVNRQTLQGSPSGVGISIAGGTMGSVWNTATTDTVNFTPAAHADFTEIVLRGPAGAQFASVTVDAGVTSHDFAGSTVPGTACSLSGSSGNSCTCTVISIKETEVDNAVDLDGAFTTFSFQTL